MNQERQVTRVLHNKTIRDKDMAQQSLMEGMVQLHKTQEVSRRHLEPDMAPQEGK